MNSEAQAAACKQWDGQKEQEAEITPKTSPLVLSILDTLSS